MRPFFLLISLVLTAAFLRAEQPWTPATAFTELGAEAQAALSVSAKTDLAGLLTASQIHWALSFRPAASPTAKTDVLAVQTAFDLAGSAAKLSPTSAAAQIAVAETAARLAYIGGVTEALPRGVAAAKALAEAKKLGADTATLDLARARHQIYLPQLLGGGPKKAAAFFEAQHAEDPSGGWNAYFCAEAYRQMKKKMPAKAWYLKAQAMGHPLAADALDRMD